MAQILSQSGIGEILFAARKVLLANDDGLRNALDELLDISLRNGLITEDEVNPDR